MSPMVTDFRGGAGVRGQMSGQGLATPHSGVQTRSASSPQLGGGARESGGGAPRYPVWTAGGGDGAIVVDVGDCILQRRRRRRRPL